jgi:hypothetical protein
VSTTIADDIRHVLLTLFGTSGYLPS